MKPAWKQKYFILDYQDNEYSQLYYSDKEFDLNSKTTKMKKTRVGTAFVVSSEHADNFVSTKCEWRYFFALTALDDPKVEAVFTLAAKTELERSLWILRLREAFGFELKGNSVPEMDKLVENFLGDKIAVSMTAKIKAENWYGS